uniref:Zinc knuckle CX2CX4HX4C domain-containing protein n=1 Tax=Cannabis sativa TaxID=3483 RepID=A0A803P9D1_CANSA
MDNLHSTLSLTDEESSILTLPEVAALQSSDLQPGFALLARVLTSQNVYKPGFIDQMSGHWQGRYPVTITEYKGEDGLFHIRFGCEGEFLEVYDDSTNEGWGPFLRIQVKLQVTKPLMRGQMIKLPKIKDEFWVDFRYERLLEFCFECGCLGHPFERCIAFMERMDRGNDDDFQYGPWMKANTSLQSPSPPQIALNTAHISSSHSLPQSALPASCVTNILPTPDALNHINHLSQDKASHVSNTTSTAINTTSTTTSTHSVADLSNVYMHDIDYVSNTLMPSNVFATYPPSYNTPFTSQTPPPLHTPMPHAPIFHSINTCATTAMDQENISPNVIPKRPSESMRKQIRKLKESSEKLLSLRPHDTRAVFCV